MSKFLENKQMIHIISETVVLIGMTFYFSQKNKKLTEKIEALSQRLEEQEDLIQKHDGIIRKLVETVNNNNQQHLTPSILKPALDQQIKKKNVKSVSIAHPAIQPLVQPSILKQSDVVKKTRASPPIEKISTPNIVRLDEDDDEDDQSFSESDLDDDIQDELKDLKKND